VTERPPRSSNVYISFVTTSVDSPTPRAKRPVSSKTGVSMYSYPPDRAAAIIAVRTMSASGESGGSRS
jgi:hypothetical protein